MSHAPTAYGYAGPTSPLKPLRDAMARYSRTGGGIAAMGIARTARPEVVGLDHCPYAARNSAAFAIEKQLKRFGMPDAIKGDHLLNFENTQNPPSGWEQFKNFFGAREKVIWESRDSDGRLHADEGPAAVTSRGTLMFMKEGRFAPGPDGFAAITVGGAGYRSPDKAAENFGQYVGVKAQSERATPEAGKKKRRERDAMEA